MTTLAEADVEAAALGWAVANDPAIARRHPTPSVPRAHLEQQIGVVHNRLYRFIRETCRE